MFKKAVIIGVGLIGGSLGMALCRWMLAEEVTGVDFNENNLLEAKRLGAVHNIEIDLEKALRKADLIVIATPVSKEINVLKRCIPSLERNTVITDVGSVKKGIVEEAERLLNKPSMFIGGHPMAGSELRGVRGADPFLFENAYYMLTPTNNTSPEALKKVKRLVENIGARPVEINPAQHDYAVAAVSHLPHAVAAVLVNTLETLKDSSSIMPFAAGGFRDTTRIASGNPEMWKDIFIANKNEILKVIKNFKESLDELETSLLKEDSLAVHKLLVNAANARSNITEKARGYLPPLYEVLATIADKPGSIANLSSCLGDAGINICDIEIMRVREGEGGTVRLGFGSDEDQSTAVKILCQSGIPARKR